MGKIRALALLIPYLLFLFYVTLIVHGIHRLGPEARLNLVPFRTITYFVAEGFKWSRHLNSWSCYNLIRGVGVNVVGNLAVFMPLGFLLPSLRRRPTTAWHALGAGAALSTVIEILQFCSARRTADLDDVLLNALGAMLGFGCLVALHGWSAAPSTSARHAEKSIEQQIARHSP